MKIAEVIELIDALRAEAKFQFEVAKSYEDGTVQGAAKAQAALNKGGEYHEEARKLNASIGNVHPAKVQINGRWQDR